MRNMLKKILPKKLQKFIRKCLQYIKRWKYVQYLRRWKYILIYQYYKMTTKLDSNKVLFMSDTRDEMTGNFKFIADALEKEGYELNSCLKKHHSDKKTFAEKRRMMKLLATSKYVLVDDYYPIVYALNLRKGTNLIQVWHALGAFKTVGFARLGKEGGPSSSSLTHRNYTGVIVSSEAIRKDYAFAFHTDIDKVHATGIPRTDVFFDSKYEENIKNEIYSKYPKLKDKKVILFAPTFRGSVQAKGYYDFSNVDFNRIKEKFKDEYVCILRPHPFTRNLDEMPSEDDFYIHMTEGREINDLLFITDILITDYSSTIFEYSLFNRKTIFYVPDLEEYMQDRDFFYPFEKYTYGIVAKDMDELMDALENGKVYPDKVKKFQDYFMSACDGKSTERFVKTFFSKE